MATVQPLLQVPLAEEILPTMQRIVTQYDAVRNEILRTVTPAAATYDSVVRPCAELDNAIDADVHVLYMLQYGAPDKATQDAFVQARRILVDAETGWTARAELFRLARGCEGKREEYRVEKAAISDLERLCHRNLAHEKGGVWFTVDALNGLPEKELVKSVEGTEPANRGKKFVPFANGGYTAVMTYARSAETRAQMYRANEVRVRENGLILDDIVRRRDAQARRLGYSNHAAVQLERRIVKQIEWVDGFLAEVREKLVPRGREELEQLKRIWRRDLQSQGKPTDGGGFPPWDQLYYQRLIEQEFDIDQGRIAEYFPLERTAAAMLHIFASVLDLRFDSIEGLAFPFIWHESVRVFSAWDGRDPSAPFLGYLYFDLQWRENKYRGNQSVVLQCGSSKPNGEQAASFCEMGHTIHNLLSQTRYARFHGSQGPRDFGEIPSTMLENWCWRKDVLKQLSCHHTQTSEEELSQWRTQHPGEADPPAQIPDQLVDDLIRGRYMGKGLWYCRLLTISLYDLKIHRLEPNQEIDLQKLWYDGLEKITGMDYTACGDGYEFATIGHLTAGYDAGYYSYLCCAALAQDLYLTRIANDAWDKKTWREFRQTVLRPGSSEENLLGLLERFLGRASNPDALVQEWL
ncbi:M3 family metallopeptidase [Aspergillus ibericus CBS 121593]|uniref:Zincin n=1 Tax=Aspergillus ibericus CBS 121593 TaxID=1448316 RepID=A0A395GU06_9EURO|nr:zincin [Aspergillus ibericus CBS 121593]RAK98936.1 zincin [Aspergillus ibericus CBS 121593]